MKLRLAMVALVALSACSSSSTAGVVSLSPSAPSSPSPSRSATASPSPSPAGPDLPLSTLSSACRLPAIKLTIGAGGGQSFDGGFITFPSAAMAVDPEGRIVSTQSGELVTTASPALRGIAESGPPHYDGTANRWLPAGVGQTSPDGASYAYGSGGTIQVVTVSTAAATTFKITVPSVAADLNVRVVSFDGRYAAYLVLGPDSYLPGIWRLDTAGGAMTSLGQLEDIFEVRDGSAWIGYLDPHDPTPPHAQSVVPLFDSIVAVNLATGARTTWFYRPGQSVRLVAIDQSGRPIVTVKPGPDYLAPGGEIRRLDEPLSGGEDNGELVYAGALDFGYVLPDGDRIWFGSERGLYLYTAADGLQKVYQFNGNGATGESMIPAGSCT